MSARDDLARVLCKADGKVYWTEHIPAIYYTLADAVLVEWLPALADPIAVALWRGWGFDLVDPEETDPVDRENVTGEIRDALAAAVEEAAVPPPA